MKWELQRVLRSSWDYPKIQMWKGGPLPKKSLRSPWGMCGCCILFSGQRSSLGCLARASPYSPGKQNNPPGCKCVGGQKCRRSQEATAGGRPRAHSTHTGTAARPHQAWDGVVWLLRECALGTLGALLVAG